MKNLIRVLSLQTIFFQVSWLYLKGIKVFSNQFVIYYMIDSEAPEGNSLALRKLRSVFLSMHPTIKLLSHSLKVKFAKKVKPFEITKFVCFCLSGDDARLQKASACLRHLSLGASAGKVTPCSQLATDATWSIQSKDEEEKNIFLLNFVSKLLFCLNPNFCKSGN